MADILNREIRQVADPVLVDRNSGRPLVEPDFRSHYIQAQP